MEQHQQRGIMRAIEMIDVDEIAIRRFPTLTA